MEISKNQKRIFYDSSRHKHILSTLVADTSDSQLWLTEEGFYLRLASCMQIISEAEERLQWLSDSGNSLHEFGNILFPAGLLINCNAGEYGYIYSSKKETCLLSLIRKPQEERLYKWYFDLTGGISYRLKIGYQLARKLISLHEAGILVNTLMPELIFIDEYKTDSATTPNIEIAVTENLSTYSRKPIQAGPVGYIDPMVKRKIAGHSTYSDTYAFAVVLFRLLTLCHPFAGEQYEELDEETKTEEIDGGCLDFVGDPEGANYSDLYDDNHIFLSNELSSLFLRTFKYGKFDLSQRPSLEEYAHACLQSINHLVRCSSDNCGKEYNDNPSHQCPFCLHSEKSILSVSSVERITQDQRILMPMNSRLPETALPPIERETSFSILKEGLNYIPRSFLCGNIPANEDKRSVAIYLNQDHGIVYVYNLLKRTTIRVGGQELLPYSKAQNNRLQIKLDHNEIVIEFPDNTNFLTEETIPAISKEYGEIHIRRMLIVKRG